jgi:hypothetical protein
VKQLGLLVSAQDKTDKNSHTAEKLSNVCWAFQQRVKVKGYTKLMIFNFLQLTYFLLLPTEV